jgi:hypothetical protein
VAEWYEMNRSGKFDFDPEIVTYYLKCFQSDTAEALAADEVVHFLD